MFLEARSLRSDVGIRVGWRWFACFYATIVVAGADDLGSIADSFTMGAAELFSALWNAIAGGVCAFSGTGHASLPLADGPRGIHRTDLVEFDAGSLKRDADGSCGAAAAPGPPR